MRQKKNLLLGKTAADHLTKATQVKEEKQTGENGPFQNLGRFEF